MSFPNNRPPKEPYDLELIIHSFMIAICVTSFLIVFSREILSITQCQVNGQNICPVEQ